MLMNWILANFPNLPASTSNRVRAICTTKNGGVSSPPFDKFNLALHVQDDQKTVLANRAILREQAKLPSEPYWLQQTHSSEALIVPQSYQKHAINEADASITRNPNHVCAVLTADCLPLLITNTEGTEVAAIHAGWRGLANGIIDATIGKMVTSPEQLHVWLGPAIGPTAFEVGEDVFQTFTVMNDMNQACFVKVGDKYLCNIYQLARIQLNSLGVGYVSGGDYCTFEKPELFYSYRREGVTGRMASLIWFNT